MSKFVDLTNKRYGKLVAKEFVGIKNNNSLWKCKCDCGNESIVYYSNLVRNHTKSCGCIFYNRNEFHGLKDTRLYRVWANIKARCYYKKCNDYNDYGGRGISMCEEWKNSFLCFYKWAYKNGYNEKAEKWQCTIERIDVNGNYEPSNCKWVTIKEQANNKTNNFKVTYKGETKTLAMWAEELDLPYKTLYSRLKYRNWSIEEAFEKPIGNNGGSKKLYHNKGTY